MAAWIQSLSLTLICSLGQGIVIYAALLALLKILPGLSAVIKYYLSLIANAILFGWFAATWWQQYHSLLPVGSGVQTTVLLLSAPGYNDTVHAPGIWSYMLSYVHLIYPWLASFYIMGVVFMLIRFASGLWQLSSLKRNGVSTPGEATTLLFNALKEKLHMRGYIQLLVSAKAQAPMVIGYIKPVILVPAAAMAQLSVQQLESILLHELVHIRRYDYFINILQAIVETALFFNPFVWLISGIIRREREHCCDDVVMAHFHEPVQYASALAAIATYSGDTSALAMAASGKPDQLFHRIKRITGMKKRTVSYSRMVAAILMITIIAGAAVWITPSFAKAKKEKETETIAPVKPVQKEQPSTKKVITRTAETPVKQASKNVAADNDTEENKLAKHMIADGLVDQVKGFVVEKVHDKLYVDGKELPTAVAAKYLSGLKQENIRVQVFSFGERLKMHPGSGFIEILLPVSFQSGCVQYEPKKPGC